MISEIPLPMVLLTAGVFLLGWILGSISARLGARHRATKRDPRDDRIRSLESELRNAQTDALQSTTKIDLLEKDLHQATEDILKRDNVITEQLERVSELKKDLQGSVRKTRELRNELSDRAAESVKSEAKLRDVETELSVAHASTELFATGLLDTAGAPKQGTDARRESPKAAKASKSGR